LNDSRLPIQKQDQMCKECRIYKALITKAWQTLRTLYLQVEGFSSLVIIYYCMYWLVCSFSVSPFCHTIWLVICLQYYSFWHRSFRQKKHSHQVSTVWCEISEYIYTTQHFERNTRVSYYSDHLKKNMLSLTTHCLQARVNCSIKKFIFKVDIGPDCSFYGQ
jgi:hypothetical protein